MTATATPGFQVLAVCSGNICRSPLVELLLRQRLSESGREKDITTASAGLIAQSDWRMPDEAKQVGRAFGLAAADLDAHRARWLKGEILASAGLVLGLTREHRAAAIELFPGVNRRAFTLMEFARVLTLFGDDEIAAWTPNQLVEAAHLRRHENLPPQEGENNDIEDPFGQTQEVYDHVGARIADCIDVIANALVSTKSVGNSIEHAESLSRARQRPPVFPSFKDWSL